MKTVKVLLGILAFVAAGLFMSSCGGGGTGGGPITPPPTVSITVAPTTTSVMTGATVQFTAKVTGSSDTAASWSVDSAPGGNATVGTVTSAGLYTAPAQVPNPSTVTVTATAHADASKSASATVTITPAPMPVASFAPSSLSFGNQNVTTSSALQTVVLTNTGTGTLNVTGVAVTGTNATDFTQSNACAGSSLAAGKSCNIVVTFTPQTSGTLTASLAVTDNAAGSPQAVPLSGTGVVPTLTMSPTAPTELLGSTQSFALNAQATCMSALFGTVPVTSSGSAYTATYTVPQALPSAWNDTVTCTATIGGSQASAATMLQYPTPTITGTSALGGSLGTLWGIQPLGTAFYINGSGFLSDLNLNVLNDRSNICGVPQVGWNQITVSLALSYTDFGISCGSTPAVWDPGFVGFTINDPATGHGGGTSNVGRLGFLGDQNQIAFNASDIFLLDPATSTVRKFKIADGSPDGSFTFTPGTGLAISVDDVTGYLVLFTGTSTEAFDPVTNAKVYELDAASPGTLHGGAAGGGWAVLSAYDGTEGFPNVLDAINLQQPGSAAVHVSVKGTPQDSPWNFQLTKLNGNLTEVVWSSYEGVLSTVDPSSLNVINSVALPNIFTFAEMAALNNQSELLGGWQLVIFNGGPAAGTAVLLSNYDQVLVYVNLATMTEIRRVDLTQPFKNANPPLPLLQSFRIAKGEADGSVLVAFADPQNGKTVLYTVDANGNMAPLTATVPFLATGLQLSPDGTTVFAGNRQTEANVPKQ
jgi:HYDIN/CFA65/VesB-like, Ig-like domain